MAKQLVDFLSLQSGHEEETSAVKDAIISSFPRENALDVLFAMAWTACHVFPDHNLGFLKSVAQHIINKNLQKEFRNFFTQILLGNAIGGLEEEEERRGEWTRRVQASAIATLSFLEDDDFLFADLSQALKSPDFYTYAVDILRPWHKARRVTRIDVLIRIASSLVNYHQNHIGPIMSVLTQYDIWWPQDKHDSLMEALGQQWLQLSPKVKIKICSRSPLAENASLLQFLDAYERTERYKGSNDRLGEIVVNPNVFRGRNFIINEKLIFLLMPFTEEWSDRIWKRILKPICNNSGFEVIRADDLYGHAIMEDIWKGINIANIIIGDITNRNPNVFYEIGIAHALGKNVILLTQKIEDVPFDFMGYRFIVYRDNIDGYEKLKSELTNTLKDIADL